MTLYPWGAKPGLWRTSRQRRSKKSGWHDVRFVCDRAGCRSPGGGWGPKAASGVLREAASAPTRRTYARGGARPQYSLHCARTPWVKRAKIPVRSS